MTFVTKGTKTTTGGVVLEGHDDILIDGKPTTSVGQKASCASGRKSCKGVGEIVLVGSNCVYLPNGSQAALPDYKVLCNCHDNFILEPQSGVNIGSGSGAVNLGGNVNMGAGVNINMGTGASFASSTSQQYLRSALIQQANNAKQSMDNIENESKQASYTESKQKLSDPIKSQVTQHVVVAFQGITLPMEEGSGNKLPPDKNSVVTNLMRDVELRFNNPGKNEVVKTSAYGSDVLDMAAKVATDFILENLSFENGEKIGKLIIYGFSWGGDTAVEVAEFLKLRKISVDLLITVDAAKGYFSGDVIRDIDVFGNKYNFRFPDLVDREIPSNVALNINYFNTNNETSGVYSKGNVNYTKSITTRVSNYPIKSTHGRMDNITYDRVLDHIVKGLSN